MMKVTITSLQSRPVFVPQSLGYGAARAGLLNKAAGEGR